jgi:hypothetical protein
MNLGSSHVERALNWGSPNPDTDVAIGRDAHPLRVISPYTERLIIPGAQPVVCVDGVAISSPTLIIIVVVIIGHALNLLT